MRGFVPVFSFLIVFPVLLFGGEVGTQRPSFGPTPEWVDTLHGFPGPRSATTNEAAEGIHYVLIDEQVNVASQENYHRTIKDFLNENGVQNGAHLTLRFDPSFEQLIIHEVRIQRGSNSIDRLQPEKIKVIQEERDLQRYIFNGTVSAVIFIEDVRAGDRVDYSYTIRGFNPILGDRYIDSFRSKFSTPLDRERFRLLWPSARTLRFQNHGGFIEPEKREKDAITEYVWDQRDVPAVITEDDVPRWYDELPWVQLSEFQSWAEVAAWAVPLYPTNLALPPDLASKIASWKEIPDPEKRLRAALQFLQDEIRYLGFEAGTQSHRPSEPATVFERRFGDCKDKAFLLCAICAQLGFEAAPAMVDTGYRGTVGNWLPSPYAFNHVIARIDAGEKSYWLDPTRSYQRGPLHLRYLPDYGKALLVRPDTIGLTVIPPYDPSLSLTTVDERFTVAKPEIPTDLTIRTLARGLDAERLRAQINDISQDDLQKRYLNYYARDYPGIASGRPLEIRDDPVKNQFEIIEHYRIKDFWTVDRDTGERECEFFPRSIWNLLERPTTTLRSMPLDIDYPRHEVLGTEVILPEPWPVDTAFEAFTNAGVELHLKRTCRKTRLLMEYDFRTTTNCVAPRDVPAYIKSIDRIEKKLGYSLTWPDDSFHASDLNWSIVSLAAVYSVLVGIGSVAFYRRARRLPPVITETESAVNDPHLNGLGGWLILIGLGIVSTPFTVGWTIVQSATVYSMSSWHALTAKSSAAYHPLWAPFLIISLLATLTLLACSILLIPLYFGKRRIFPKVFIFSMLFSALVVLTDHFGAQIATKEKDESGIEDTRMISRACLPCFIWIPYMLKSRRVKSTFVK